MASRKQQSRKQQARKQHAKTVRTDRPVDASSPVVSSGSVKATSRPPVVKAATKTSPSSRPSPSRSSTSSRVPVSSSDRAPLSAHDRKLVSLALVAALLAGVGGVLLYVYEPLGLVLGALGVVGILAVTWLSTRDPEVEHYSRTTR